MSTSQTKLETHTARSKTSRSDLLDKQYFVEITVMYILCTLSRSSLLRLNT